MILSTRFNADETLDLLREHRPTIFPLVPAICDAISDQLERQNRDGDGFSSTVGPAALPERHRAPARRRPPSGSSG